MAVCLVTGGAGFIGSHLVEALVERGHSVRVLDDLSTGSLRNLSAVEGRVEVLVGTVTDAVRVREATTGADYIFHLAAPPAGAASLADPLGTHHAGATGTLQVLLAARDANVRCLVYASSCSVYGPADGRPRHEDDALRPLSPYAVAKLTGEQQCLGCTGLYGLATVRLRYFNVFGPRQSAASPYAGAVAQALRRMLAGRAPVVPAGAAGQQDLIYVDDVVHATLLAASAPRAAGRVYNVASGRLTTPAALVAALNDVLGTRLQPVEDPARPEEELGNAADVRRAEADLGFCPATDLDKGLRRCLESYLMRNNGLVCVAGQ
jgi:UDP-glucose 4-epimerase